MKIMSLEDLFIHKLSDLYSAEHQILEALPNLIENVTNEELKKGLSNHLEQTKTHVERLDTLHAAHGFDTDIECEGIAGIIEEGEETLEDIEDDATLDAAIIAAIQSVEHYEIAGYGSAKAYAKELGYTDEEALLDDTLSEEYEADKLLTNIAEGGFFQEGVNKKAE